MTQGFVTPVPVYPLPLPHSSQQTDPWVYGKVIKILVSPVDAAGTSGLKRLDQSKALLGRPVLLASGARKREPRTWQKTRKKTIKATRHTHAPVHRHNFPAFSVNTNPSCCTNFGQFKSYYAPCSPKTTLSLWKMTIRKGVGECVCVWGGGSPMCNQSESPRIKTVSHFFPIWTAVTPAALLARSIPRCLIYFADSGMVIWSKLKRRAAFSALVPCLCMFWLTTNLPPRIRHVWYIFLCSFFASGSHRSVTQDLHVMGTGNTCKMKFREKQTLFNFRSVTRPDLCHWRALLN